MEELVNRIAETAAAEGLWRAGDSLVVAVSGGPDSTALLHALHRLSARDGLKLTAAHVNHGFRKTESAREAETVRSFCERLGIPFELAELDVPARIAETKQNAQLAAREMRYAFLHAAAARRGASAIVLGHHADDQAETVLMRLLRGAGPSGLAGMAYRRTEKNVELVRPLLRITKTELLTYCEGEGLPYCTDSSNLKRDYLRNRIRLDLMPELREINPQLTQSLCRLAEISAAEDDLLAAETERLRSSLARTVTGGHAVRRADLAGLHVALQRRLVKLLLNCLAGDGEAASFERIEEIRAASAGAEEGWSADLGGGIRAELKQGELRLVRPLHTPDGAANGFAYPVERSAGRVVVPESGGVFLFEVHGEDAAPEAQGRNEAIFDLETTAFPLTIRSRRPGDRMAVRGLNGTKKVQDMFVDAKVDAARRDRIPLLADAEGRILWIPGLRRSRYGLPSAGRPSVRVIYLEQGPAKRD